MLDLAGLHVCLCAVPYREGIYTDSEGGGHAAGLYTQYSHKFCVHFK